MQLRNSKIHALLVLLGVTLLFGCTTALKRANEMLEKGMYDDAIAGYQQVLAKNPEDVEAKQGLARARSGYVDSKLIEVRKARVAGSETQSLDLLSDAIRKQQEWNIRPSGAAAFTQEEERGYAIRNAAARVQSDLHSKFPLRAEHFLRKYELVFDGDTRPRYDALKAQVRAGGKAQCKEFQKAKLSGKPSLTEFTVGFCEYWGESSRRNAADFATLTTGLYREPTFAIEVSNLTAESRALLEIELRKAFERTGWYEPKGGKSVSAHVTGSFRNDSSRKRLYLTHLYTEKVPYAEIVRRKVVRNGKETWEERKETQYRDETREYRYHATEHRQKLHLGLVAQLKFEETVLPVSLTETSASEGIEHYENQPSIGLKPSRPNLQDAPAWIKAQTIRYGKEFEKELAHRWRDRHCTVTTEDADFETTGERVAFCLRQKFDDPPSFTQSWYRSYLGVTVQEARWVLQGQ